ncbi:YifB family Mg chelatase-like AAA ATPase [Alphaproteobacteria bacterium]|nr:YifB family Mg chelatase-like AAA ATPase [Alphaproteobacteria bacterium]
MQSKIKTVAFRGVETIDVEVQVHIANGLPAIAIVGLADKAVAESKERVRAALSSIGLALPPKRIAINLAPSDVVKEGAHFDLPIAHGLLVAMGVVPGDAVQNHLVLGALSLSGTIEPVSGILPAAIAAVGKCSGLICPEGCGPEAAWAGDIDILVPPDPVSLLNQIRGTQMLRQPTPILAPHETSNVDMANLKGQETARRVLEITAAGGHNLLLVGPPGAGKSMLAARLSGLLPPLTASEALEVTMLHSVAGQLVGGGLIQTRPYREPHHSASMPALVGGGARAKPGEISLAHHGVLFLDELAEFARPVLDALRQPLETGKIVVARANHNVSYLAEFQLIAAMNPCRCGYLGDPSRACSRAPGCGRTYSARVSGPMMDRFDLIIEVPDVPGNLLLDDQLSEPTAAIAARVLRARAFSQTREGQEIAQVNARLTPDQIDKFGGLAPDGAQLLRTALDKQKLSARGFHKVLRVARTIADLDLSAQIARHHLAEALAYRAMPLLA